MHLRFDRGTIVLANTPAGLDLTGAPGILWDARVEAHRAPASMYAAVVRWLRDRAIPFVDAAHGGRGPTAGWADPELRDYQAAALFAWELASRRGVVVLPTGSGKTRVALGAMASTRLPALCLVPTRVLLEQWRREIASVYAHPAGCHGDGRRDVAPVTVATYESAYRHMDHLGAHFGLLIVDEVHHFGCGFRDEALEMTVASARLGLTATPPRDAAHATRLAELIGPTVYELAIGDLTGRFLAEFDAIVLHLDLADAERARYAALSRVFTTTLAAFLRTVPQATWTDVVRAASRTAEGRRALAAWREARRLLALTDAKRRALQALLARHRDARVKGGKTQDIPLPSVMAVLKLYVEHVLTPECEKVTLDTPLFWSTWGRRRVGRTRQPMAGKNIWRTCKTYGRLIGYPELRPHALRHGVAVEVLEQRHDLEEVRALLGHARIDTTQIYTRIRPPQLKRAVAFYEAQAQRMLTR